MPVLVGVFGALAGVVPGVRDGRRTRRTSRSGSPSRFRRCSASSRSSPGCTRCSGTGRPLGRGGDPRPSCSCPPTWYLGAWWGQLDAVYVALCLWAAILAARDRRWLVRRGPRAGDDDEAPGALPRRAVRRLRDRSLGGAERGPGGPRGRRGRRAHLAALPPLRRDRRLPAQPRLLPERRVPDPERAGLEPLVAAAGRRRGRRVRGGFDARARSADAAPPGDRHDGGRRGRGLRRRSCAGRRPSGSTWAWRPRRSPPSA